MDADARARGLLPALFTDRPWNSLGERQVVYLTALLGGQFSGILEGALLCDPNYGIPGLTGDAEFWDTVACGAWLGSAAGIACGIGLVATRNLWGRVTLAAMAGAVLFTLVLTLVFGGNAPGRWEGDGLRRSLTFLDRPIGWGVYLGSGWSGSAALVLHLIRRCAGTPRLLLGTVILGIVVGTRSQSFFWSEWNSLHPPAIACRVSFVEYPAAPGGVLCTLALMAAGLFAGLAVRRIRPQVLSLILGGVVATVALLLAWAVRAMPLTSESPITGVTFSEDDRELITVHEGNTVRLWDCGDDHPPREAGRWRFVKPSRWHEPVVLSHPLAACLGKDGIRIWELPMMRRLGIIRLAGDDWDGLAFSPDGSILAASRPGEIRPFRLFLEGSPRRLEVSPGVPATNSVYGGIQGRRHFTISDTGVVSFGPAPGTWTLLGENTWTAGVETITTLQNGTSILAQEYRKKTYIWNSGQPGTQMEFSPPMKEIRASPASRDGRFLMLWSGGDRWTLDVAYGIVLRHERSSAPPPEFLLASPHDLWIAAARGTAVETWKWPKQQSIKH